LSGRFFPAFRAHRQHATTMRGLEDQDDCEDGWLSRAQPEIADA